jgi:type I restriction enzyme S subunit
MNNQLLPKIRFEEFKGEWDEKELTHFLSVIKTKNKDGRFKRDQVLSVAADAGIVNQIQYHGRSYAGKSLLPYNVVEIGDIVYTKSPLKAYPYGIIKENSNAPGVVSTLYAVYRPKNSAIGKFIDFYFSLPEKGNRYLKPLVNIGAKNDMKVNNATVLMGKVTFPTLPEQQKIATFLSLVDRRLAVARRQVDLLERWKRGVMQLLIREKRAEWEFFYADKLFKNISNKKHNGELPVLAITQDGGAVFRSDLDRHIHSSEKSIASYKIVEPGDFIISLRSFQGGIEYSKIKGIASPAYTILKPKMPVDDDFYRSYLKYPDFISRLDEASIGIRDGRQISYATFSELKLPYPPLKEQTYIATILTSIDARISAADREVAGWEAWKKGLLQKMLV